MISLLFMIYVKLSIKKIDFFCLYILYPVYLVDIAILKMSDNCSIVDVNAICDLCKAQGKHDDECTCSVPEIENLDLFRECLTPENIYVVENVIKLLQGLCGYCENCENYICKCLTELPSFELTCEDIDDPFVGTSSFYKLCYELFFNYDMIFHVLQCLFDNDFDDLLSYHVYDDKVTVVFGKTKMEVTFTENFMKKIVCFVLEKLFNYDHSYDGFYKEIWGLIWNDYNVMNMTNEPIIRLFLSMAETIDENLCFDYKDLTPSDDIESYLVEYVLFENIHIQFEIYEWFIAKIECGENELKNDEWVNLFKLCNEMESNKKVKSARS